MPFKTFHLFIVDHDNKRFSVEGPMNNDSLWRDRVVIEKMKGRDVRCFSVKESSSLKASSPP